MRCLIQSYLTSVDGRGWKKGFHHLLCAISLNHVVEWLYVVLTVVAVARDGTVP